MSIRFLGGLSLCLVLSVLVLAKFTAVEEPKLSKNKVEWQELCAATDCSQYPVGYATYVFGPEVYYFPQYDGMTEKPPNVLTGGVKAGTFYETGDDGRLLRSYGNGSNLIIADCCRYLLAFYGLAEEFPALFPERYGKRMPPARLNVSAHDYQHRNNPLARRFDIHSKDPPSINALISDDHLSYSEDFWLLDVSKTEEGAMGGFSMLSKRPILNGRRTYVACGPTCTVSTVAFAEDVDNQRPHIHWKWMAVSLENEFLCSPEELEQGCAPAPEFIEKILTMIDLIDDMFEAAQVFPEKRA